VQLFDLSNRSTTLPLKAKLFSFAKHKGWLSKAQMVQNLGCLSRGDLRLGMYCRVYRNVNVNSLYQASEIKGRCRSVQAARGLVRF